MSVKELFRYKRFHIVISLIFAFLLSQLLMKTVFISESPSVDRSYLTSLPHRMIESASQFITSTVSLLPNLSFQPSNNGISPYPTITITQPSPEQNEINLITPSPTNSFHLTPTNTQTTPTTNPTHQPTHTPTPTNSSNPTWIQYEDKDSHFSYSTSKNPNPKIYGISQWNENKSVSGGYEFRGGTGRQSPAAGAPNDFDGVAKLDLSNEYVRFDQIRVGYVKSENRGVADVYLDGTKIDSFSQRGEKYAKGVWESSSFTCGAHNIEVHVTDKTADHKNYITLDYIDVHQCN